MVKILTAFNCYSLMNQGFYSKKLENNESYNSLLFYKIVFCIIIILC